MSDICHETFATLLSNSEVFTHSLSFPYVVFKTWKQLVSISLIKSMIDRLIWHWYDQTTVTNQPGVACWNCHVAFIPNSDKPLRDKCPICRGYKSERVPPVSQCRSCSEDYSQRQRSVVLPRLAAVNILCDALGVLYRPVDPLLNVVYSVSKWDANIFRDALQSK